MGAEMADKDDQNDKPDELKLSNDEADALLNEGGDTEDASESGTEKKPATGDDKDWKADADRWKMLSRQNEKAFKDTAAKLKKYEDEGKSESQRLQEERDSHKTRAEKAEAQAKAFAVAMERAPEHASLAQVRAVAKRVRGDDEDALERDADELFGLLAPEPSEPKPGTKTPSRPKERLKGGTAEPDEDPEETDPRKLAALLPRRR
jgi:hypothetical protein